MVGVVVGVLAFNPLGMSAGINPAAAKPTPTIPSAPVATEPKPGVAVGVVVVGSTGSSLIGSCGCAVPGASGLRTDPGVASGTAQWIGPVGVE